MKTVTLEQMQIIAETYGGKLIFEGSYPCIEFEDGDYGFESTELDYDDKHTLPINCYGFKFFGQPSKQSLPHVMKCRSNLTEPAIVGDMLTLERAKQLIGKKIEVSYHDYNEGSERFKIVGMDQRDEKSIGQNKSWHLHTIPIDEAGNELQPYGSKQYEDWAYEWQGIFRRGSGAERLFIEKIFE